MKCIWEYAQLHIPSNVLKHNINSSLALINTVYLLFSHRIVLGRRLNKPQYLKPSESSHRCLFEVETERESQQGTEQVRRRRFQIGDATSHMLQGDEVQISALKEYVPCRHVWDLYVFLPFFLHIPVFKIQSWRRKRRFEIFSSPERIFETIELAG